MTTLALPGGPATQRRCALYRHFDDQDVLLYVGITESLGDRTNSGHARTSDWVQFAVRAEAEWLDSRDLASSAERDAVRDERPVFNRQYAEWDVDRQIMEYLHQREIEEFRATAEEYEFVVRRFLAAAPKADVDDAQKKALEDYRCAGTKLDHRFPASVLRHYANAVIDRTTDAQDDASAEAYRGVIQFAGQQLEAIRERRQRSSEPPF
jgi:hypothetical protein